MALTADQNWWVRTPGSGGSDSYAGGYDSTISGAGVNYANQSTPQVQFSGANGNRLNCSDHTGTAGNYTITSDGTPFTSAMVGNCIRVDSGTNFTAGFYIVKIYISSSSVRLDRDPTNGSTGSLGVGYLGGAFTTPLPLCISCTAGSPAITSPLTFGHVVNVEGSGSDAPSSATFSWSNNYTFPIGHYEITGMIKFVSTSGKVRIDQSSTNAFAVLDGHMFKDFYWMAKANSSIPFMDVAAPGGDADCAAPTLYQCVIDQNGYGRCGTSIPNLLDCGFLNSGEGSVAASSSYSAYQGVAQEPVGTRYGRIVGCSFIGWKAGAGTPEVGQSNGGNCPGAIDHSNWLNIDYNIFANITGSAVRNGTSNGNSSFIGNTLYNVSGHGLHLFHGAILDTYYLIRGNIFYACGGYGIYSDTTDGGGWTPDRFCFPGDYNAFRVTSGLGTILGRSGGAHDITLTADPFNNAAALDFRLNNVSGGGALLRNGGWPNHYLGTTT